MTPQTAEAIRLSQPAQVKRPATVEEFLEAHGIAEYLAPVVARVKVAFPEALRVEVVLESDPESHHQWVVVEAIVDGPLPELYARHKEVSRDMDRLLPRRVDSLIWTSVYLPE
jgi:hypothetical protein